MGLLSDQERISLIQTRHLAGPRQLQPKPVKVPNRSDSWRGFCYLCWPSLSLLYPPLDCHSMRKDLCHASLEGVESMIAPGLVLTDMFCWHGTFGHKSQLNTSVHVAMKANDGRSNARKLIWAVARQCAVEGARFARTCCSKSLSAFQETIQSRGCFLRLHEDQARST